MTATLSLLTAFALLGGSLMAAEKPNIVLILADDMGFSDLGCYGSEIPTPNLDALAQGGLRFTQFYNSARCSPTRAALLTGLDPHQAGMGRLASEKTDGKQVNPEGYLGYLNSKCVTIAEALHPAGYQSCIVGKWHLGQRGEEKWPLQRGFDRFYGILTGVTSYFTPKGLLSLYLDNEKQPTPTEPGYYTTDAFTDFAIKTVVETPRDRPFFLYLSYTAPHWPLHAREEDIAKFVGKYRSGWDTMRAARHAKMQELGIVSKAWPLSERDDGARAWDALSDEEKTKLDYRMAVYAAQIHRMDWNIGRLVTSLREQGKLENTLLMFLSDNGGCAEPYTDLGGQAQGKINHPDEVGAVSYGTGWANVSNTPFRKYKSTLYEGGMATPLVVHWPAGLKTKSGSLDATPGYLTDIMPTLLDVTGAKYPTDFAGQKTTPLVGRSLLPIFSGAPNESSPRVFCWEQYGNKAVRTGDLKAVFYQGKKGEGGKKWELYDLSLDRTERIDLAEKRPEDLKKLVVEWDAWAARSQVFPSPSGEEKKKAKKK